MKLDGRTLDHSTLEALRKRSVHQIVTGETTAKDVALAMGLNVSTVHRWVRWFQGKEGRGLDAIPLRGRPTKLNEQQRKRIIKLVIGKDPRQLKFPFALWTRDMVKELIWRTYGVSMALSSVGSMLHDMGLSVQKPKYRAWEQDSEAVRRWKEEEYPSIVKQAKKVGAQIYFQDEAGIRSDYHSGTTWAIKGQTPVVETTGARFGVNMISAISPRGHLRFMCVQGTVNAAVFIEFLKRMVHNSPYPIYLIVDGHPTHRSIAARKYVESTEGKLKLFFLPSYSPQLNPDESVWREVKNHDIGRRPVTGPKHLHALALAALHRLQKSPATLRNLFKTPELAYILDA